MVQLGFFLFLAQLLVASVFGCVFVFHQSSKSRIQVPAAVLVCSAGVRHFCPLASLTGRGREGHATVEMW